MSQPAGQLLRLVRVARLLGVGLLLVAAQPVVQAATAQPVQPAQPPEDAGGPAPVPLLVADGARDLSIEELLADPPAFRFPRGERVVFEVRYMGIPVGRVTKEIVGVFAWKGRRIAHVVGTARTNAFFSTLWRVDDRSESWIDIDAFRTLQTATLTRHGRRREVYEEASFDWETHFVHVLEDKRWKRTREFSLDFGPDVYDTFEAVYAIRSMPLEEPIPVEIPVYASFKVYGLGIPPGETEEVAGGPLGAVPAVKLQPSNTLDGEAQGDGRGQVWFGASGRRVPLRVRGWMRPYTGIRLGGVSADLVEYEPGDPAWEALPLLDLKPRAGVAPSERGKPSWRVPQEIREARRRAGIDSVDRRHTDQRMEAIQACGALPMLERFVAPPGEPGRALDSDGGAGADCAGPPGLSGSDEARGSAVPESS